MPKQHIFKSILLLLVLAAVALADDSIINKIEDYPFMKYKIVAGLSYPEHLDYVDYPTNFTLRFINISSYPTLQASNITYSKRLNSTCQFALETISYGYYTKFPFYRIIGDCMSQDKSYVLSIRVYRSGQFEVVEGDIVDLTPDERNCNLGPLRVSNSYSPSGDQGKYVYRFCKTKNASIGQSLFKEYLADAKKSYIFKQDSITQITGLTNISLADVEPGVGPYGKFNIFLSEKYGLIINGGSKFVQTTWQIPGGEKPYKVQRICWENTLAVLTEGYIYFVNITYINNSSATVDLLRKTPKISVDASSCSFFTIGRNAICSTANASGTVWNIYGVDTSLLNNRTQLWVNQAETPYISEDYCSSNSFYWGSSRYQLYIKSNFVSQQKPVLHKKQLGGRFGEIRNFLDAGSLFIVSTIAQPTYQTLFYSVFSKAKLDAQYYSIAQTNITLNSSDFNILYEKMVLGNNFTTSMVSVVWADLNTNKTTFNVMYPYSSTFGAWQRYKDFSIDVPITNIGLLKNNINSRDIYNYVAYTPIEVNTVARVTSLPNNNPEIRYAYEFEAASCQICTVNTRNNQILLFRKDSLGLTVFRAGFRNFNTLVLDDIRLFMQYRNFKVECAHDGIILSNAQTGQIYILDNELVLIKNINSSFSDFKFTRSLLLLQTGGLVEVRSIANGDLYGVYRWNLADVVTSMHSSGFINTKENVYYEFGNGLSEMETFEDDSVEVKNLRLD